MKLLINAIASGNVKTIEQEKSKVNRKVKTYTTAKEFLFDVYKSVMTIDGKPRDLGEYDLQLSREDQNQLNELNIFLDERNK